MKKGFKKADVVRRLGEIACGKANDAVKLAFMTEEQLSSGKNGMDGLDLTMLSELKRIPGGAVEVKMVNRIEALKLMLEALSNEPGNEADTFFSALGNASKEV